MGQEVVTEIQPHLSCSVTIKSDTVFGEIHCVETGEWVDGGGWGWVSSETRKECGLWLHEHLPDLRAILNLSQAWRNYSSKEKGGP